MLRFVRWFARRCPLRVLYCTGGEYLRRHYVFGNKGALYLWPEGTEPRLGWLPFTVYLHEFVRPDEDSDLHNHPWSTALSLMLLGGYDEERFGPDEIVVRNLCRPVNLRVRRSRNPHGPM